MSLNESWQRHPDARVRMTEGKLPMLIAALSKGGTFISGHPLVQLLDDGILITFCTNAGARGKLIALPIDVFIPCEVPKENEPEEPELDDSFDEMFVKSTPAQDPAHE